jgi:hypothetical protein
MRVSRKDIFLAKLFLASSIVHGIIFFCCCFVMHGDRFTQRIDFSMLQHQQVVFLPFQKSVRRGTPGAKGASGEQNVFDAQKSQTPVSPKTTLARSSNSRRGKKGKGSNKAPQQKIKKERKAAPVDTKKLERAAQEQKQHDSEQLVQAEQALAAVGNPNPVADAGPIYLGQDDLDNLEIAHSIREEVANVWRPPTGLGVGRQCKVKVIVDWDGAIKELTFEESSTIAAFDISVRLAVQQMKFPKAVFGKEIILPFVA